MSLSFRDMGRKLVSLVLFAGMTLMATNILAETLIIPAVSFTGTYDSNVYYTPKALLPTDVNIQDYYVSIVPQITAAHRGSLIDGSLTAGALITRYHYNNDLDYTGINTAGTVNLRNWVYKAIPRIESLSITGLYQYTPTMSAFGASGIGTAGAGYGTTGLVGPLDAGLITNRVSMHIYSATITSGYQLTPMTTLTGNYSYNQISFGDQSGGLSAALFDTIAHQGTLGLSKRITQTESIGGTTTFSYYTQGAESVEGMSTGSSDFTTIQAMGTWVKQWTHAFTTALGAGGILTLPIETGIPGETIKSTVTPAASVALNYTSFSEALKSVGSTIASVGPFEGLPPMAGTLSPGGILQPGRYTASVSYSLGVFPSYAIGAGPITTHVLGTNATGGIVSSLTGQVGVNYSHGSGNAPLQSFDTLGATVGLNYLFASTFLGSISYNWLYFSSSITESGQNPIETSFSKSMVMISLSYAFNGQAFFSQQALSGLWKPTGSPAQTAPTGPSVDTPKGR